ncbi:MAG TPA: FliA/WhiG family RNA polymerase sigma factor [Spirochaetota bacterium]|nr:FliA/WhiG family RNA polymerase sigma factor [Spirochaetota bacterium]HOM38086.1 FliA/WhiG family RNA polymerase sigma factor [Spirochaetota bacterium]HPQ48888.1 FliA/WhiG family RNA polymerase sigma factor [Spirochaetota bacterium]
MEFNNEFINISEEEELELWKRYKKNGDPKARETLIIKYAPLVKYAAGKIAIGMPKSIEFDDLVGYGFLGLLDAIDKFDLSKNTKFKTYALTRINGSIFDELRAKDWVPRTIRQKGKELERVIIELEEKLNRYPTDEEISEALGIAPKDLQKLYMNLSMTTIKSFYEPPVSVSPENEKMALINTIEAGDNLTPDKLTERKELEEIISKIIEELPEKEKQVLILYYYEDLTLKEIAEALDVTESRVSQIHSKTLFKIKIKMKKIKNQMKDSQNKIYK